MCVRKSNNWYTLCRLQSSSRLMATPIMQLFFEFHTTYRRNRATSKIILSQLHVCSNHTIGEDSCTYIVTFTSSKINTPSDCGSFLLLLSFCCLTASYLNTGISSIIAIMSCVLTVSLLIFCEFLSFTVSQVCFPHLL